MSDLAESFKKADVNGDGTLCASELRTVLGETRRGAPPSLATVERVIVKAFGSEKLETGLSLEDFTSMMSQISEGDESCATDILLDGFLQCELAVEDPVAMPKLKELLKFFGAKEISHEDINALYTDGSDPITFESLLKMVHAEFEDSADQDEHAMGRPGGNDGEAAGASALQAFSETDAAGSTRSNNRALQSLARHLIQVAHIRHQEQAAVRSALAEPEEDPIPFVGEKHLAYSKPEWVKTLTALNLKPDDLAVSDFAVTAPFQLLSSAGVEALRTEIAKDQVVRNCKFTSFSRAPNVLHGMALFSSFTHDLFRSQEFVTAVRDATGLPLRPHPLDYEIAHVNIQENGAKKAAEAWHCDSMPFVMVLMLSDPEGMEGGETVIMDGDGNKHAVKYARAGECIILQGMAVRHTVNKARNMGRTTVVQAMTLDVDGVQDLSNLFINVDYANPEELYRQWATYRLKDLSGMLNREVEKLEQLSFGQQINVTEVVNKIQFLETHLANTRASLLTGKASKKNWIKSGSLRKMTAEASSEFRANALQALGSKELDDKELEELFNSIDGDGSGQVTGAELRVALLKRGVRAKDAESAVLIHMGDDDNDGTLDLKEFKTAWRSCVWTKQ